MSAKQRHRWPTETLGAILRIENAAIKPQSGESYRYLGLENIAQNTGEIIAAPDTDGLAIASTKYLFSPSHVLYGKLRPNLNKVALPDFNGVCSTDILPLTVGPLALKEYVAFYLRSPGFVHHAVQHATGTKMPRFGPKELLRAPIPVPPLPTQEQIVHILQKADTIRHKRQDARNLAAAVLPAIFQSMFGDPSASDQLQELDTAINSIRNGISRRRKTIANEGQIVLRIQDVGDGSVDFEDVNRIRLNENERDALTLRPGDMLMVRVNGNPDLVGRNALFFGYEEPVAHNDHLMRVRFNTDMILPEYVAAFLRTPFGRNALRSKVVNSAGNHSINQDGITGIRIPIPPIGRQSKFLDAARQHGIVLLGLEKAAREATEIFAGLLARAFSGELTTEWETTNSEWIASEVEFQQRLPQLVLLALIREKARRTGGEAAQTAVLVTALMKYAFLAQMEGSGQRRFYQFVPYHYGPFAKELYEDLERLREQGLISVDNGDEDKTRITLVDPARAEEALNDLPEDLRDDAVAILDAYGDLDHNSLLDAVYEKYPAYAKKSRRGKKTAKAAGSKNPAKKATRNRGAKA